jgi:hypothetical protein
MSLKTKTYLTLLIFLIFLGLLIFFLKNLFSEIKNISVEISSKKGEILLLEKRAENAKSFADFFQREMENFKKVESLFINPETPIEFIEFLEKESGNLGLSLEIFLHSPIVTEEDPWPSIGFRLNLSGSFPKFLKFLEKLELAPYLIEIQGLKISRVEEKTEELKVGEIKAEISIKVFTK